MRPASRLTVVVCAKLIHPGISLYPSFPHSVRVSWGTQRAQNNPRRIDSVRYIGKESIMFVVTVDFVIHEQHVENFRQAVENQARNSLEQEEGCHQFDVCYDIDDDTAVFLYEIYSDRDAFEEHLDTEHYLDFDASVKDWVAKKDVSQWVLA